MLTSFEGNVQVVTKCKYKSIIGDLK